MSDITYTRITPAGEEKCSLLDGDGMTRKEWVAKMYPVKVWKGFGGGVEGCPADYSELCEIDEHAHDCKRNCVLNGGDGCGICWNTVIVSPVNFTKANPNDEIDSEVDAVESADGKIRTPIARIIIGGSAERPCYSIQYFDPSDKEFHIGFSSYALNYVQEWFEAYFDIVNEPTCIPYIKPENVAVQNDDAVESDAVNHPNHYTQNGIECIAAIRASMTADGFMDYCKGNVIKYIWRWRDKGGVEDLKKAKVYLEWLIEEAEKC